MPTGPKGQKRPADVISAAVKVMRIATGQEEETDPTKGKDAAAVARGRTGGAKGGRSRAASLSEERRTAIARKAAGSRWAKKEPVD